MHQSIPKQFLSVNERPVIIYTLEAFQNHADIDAIAVVCIEGWEQVLWAYAKQFNINKLKYVVPGGKNGQDSIRNGVFELEKYYDPEDIVLIHDSIRPMVSADIISDCIVKTKKIWLCYSYYPLCRGYASDRRWTILHRQLSERSFETDTDPSGISFRKDLRSS